MPEQPHCPDRPSLERLLAGTLPAVEQDALAQHVEGCPQCQRTLEVLSGTSWSDEVRRLGGDNPAPEPALNQVIDRALSRDATEVTQAGPPANTDDLSFLSPSSTPGHLGRLGRCEVLEVLGKGGFGTVLRAFDEKLRRIVAIKVLAPELAASGTARKRFIREAQAAAAVKNDHVVAIYNVEDEAHPPYLVMELIEGITLQGRLDKDGPLELKEILRIGMQMAEGLTAAHKQGLVHRDIKPANTLLENGVERVKITDFGLARAVDDASLTQSGVVAGTPMYMSPEQAEGQTIDHRSDLFSLGTVLYVMCTGRPPFRATGTIAVLKRVIEETPRPIREINPDIPEWLVDIIGKLHAKKPEDRYQTAKEVAEILGTKLAELQMHGRSGVGQAPRPPAAPRSRRRVALALALLLLVGIGAAITFWPRGDSETPDTRGNPGEKPLPKPSVVNAKPFVILAREKPEQQHPTLAAAAADAKSGDTIEISGDGPFVTEPIDLGEKYLAIRAGAGFRPVLQLDPAFREKKNGLIVSWGVLILEGLELRTDSTATNFAHLIVMTKDSSLIVRHCRLVSTGAKAYTLSLNYTSKVDIQNTEAIATRSRALAWSSAPAAKLFINRSVLYGGYAGLAGELRQWPRGEVSLTCKQSTVLGGQWGCGLGWSKMSAPDDKKELPTFLVDVSGNVIHGNSGLLYLGADIYPGADSSINSAIGVRDFLSSVGTWKIKEGVNLLGPSRPFLFVGNRFAGRASFPQDWKAFWKTNSAPGIAGAPKFQGGDLLSLEAAARVSLTATNFRLAAGSPGKGKGEGSKDLGADVDRVGPGKPYEDWKKTPEYGKWCKEIEKLLKGP